MTRSIYILIIMILILFPGEDWSWAGENAPSFSLMQWGTEKQVSLDDFRGQIVVLDFFNAGCVRCFRASWEVETGIQDFYAARNGNPHGIAVRVVSINSEMAPPEEINAFIEENELDMVLDNSDGAILRHYGGTTVPYLVVIDATGAEPAVPPRVVYRQPGFDGLDKLYEVINAITGQADPVENGSNTLISTTYEKTSSLPVREDDLRINHEMAMDIASLSSSDIFVTETLAEYNQKRPSMEFTLALSYRHIEAEYESEYLGDRREKDLTTDWIGIHGSASFDLNEVFTLEAQCGAYDGYQTYRALWLNEYYRHLFDVLGEYINDLYGYKKAHPRGYNISSGLRWEYSPDTGFADASISYQRDMVSPGYKIGVPIVRLRDKYDTFSGSLSTENVITRKLRTKAECSINYTTDRNARFALQGALNYALAENWVSRIVAAGSKESPDFTSKSISAVLEWDWHSTWFVSLFGRYYEDTSEIANAMVSNAAPPPIESYQTGMGVRRQGHSSSFKFVAGPCFSKYQRKPDRDVAFDQLYKDRDWLSVQFAYHHRF